VCETQYQPGLLPEQRLEQFLHNVSTWQDALRVERATGQLALQAGVFLDAAGDLLEDVRSFALRALAVQCASGLVGARTDRRTHHSI
jgi:hypothetical protein